MFETKKERRVSEYYFVNVTTELVSVVVVSISILSKPRARSDNTVQSIWYEISSIN